MTNLPATLEFLASACNGELIGNGQRIVESICSIKNLKQNGLTFVASNIAKKYITDDEDVFFIVKSDFRNQVANGICHDNPEQAIRQILVALTHEIPVTIISESSIVSPSASIGKNVCLGANSFIGENVVIGDNAVIGIGSVIERDVHIGNNTRIGHRAIIHNETVIGANCLISEGAVIGCPGFGFSLEGGQWNLIPQIGRAIIGNNVYIGANSCVARGAIEDTEIGNNVIIDNLVHIAHNVRIKEGVAMAAGVCIAGSTEIGKNCLIAGQVGIIGHIKIADGVQINGGARVLQSIKESGTYSGSFHVQPSKKWNRIAVYLKQLENLFKRDKNEY